GELLGRFRLRGVPPPLSGLETHRARRAGGPPPSEEAALALPGSLRPPPPEEVGPAPREVRRERRLDDLRSGRPGQERTEGRPEMKRADPLALLRVARVRTPDEDRRLADACRGTLTDYRKAVCNGGAPARARARARRALLHLGGDPARSSASLKDYDHERYGPFLGVSDEGSAAGPIRDAALESPKVRALPRAVPPTPLVVGVAVDAERLGGIGEGAVGPNEYADVWLDWVDRVLITTSVGPGVNVRVYRREPLVLLKSDRPRAIEAAKREIAAAFEPFVETPDNRPRPLTVFVDV